MKLYELSKKNNESIWVLVLGIISVLAKTTPKMINSKDYAQKKQWKYLSFGTSEYFIIMFRITNDPRLGSCDSDRNSLRVVQIVVTQSVCGSVPGRCIQGIYDVSMISTRHSFPLPLIILALRIIIYGSVVCEELDLAEQVQCSWY